MTHEVRCPECESVMEIEECEDCLLHAHRGSELFKQERVSRRQYRIPTCSHGHELTPENTCRQDMANGKARNACRTCMVEYTEKRRKQAEAVTHCRNGHPLSPEDTYISATGNRRRRCLVCGRAAHKARKEKRDAGVA